jgi:hypothetical protein
MPYAWKFAISPFIKNAIIRYSDKFDIIKYIAYLSQVIVLIFFSILGWLTEFCPLIWLGAVIFLIVTAATVHDVVIAHIKICLFQGNALWRITSVENAGFRIGMFLSGACILYIAELIGWATAYFIVGFVSFAVIISTFCMPNLQNITDTNYKTITYSVSNYLTVCAEFFKKHGILLMIFLFIAFKFSDSCINCLKGMFLHSLGIEKFVFANIAHLIGTISMIISGILAAYILTKIGSKKCVMLSFAMHMVASLEFIYLALYRVDIVNMTIIINIETFIFGFSNVVFRAFMAEQSAGNVNVYTMLLSVGSGLRILSYGIGGILADNFLWITAYIVCLVSNIPGLLVCLKWFNSQTKKNL